MTYVSTIFVAVRLAQQLRVQHPLDRLVDDRLAVLGLELRVRDLGEQRVLPRVVGHDLGRVVREVRDAVERAVALGEVHPALASCATGRSTPTPTMNEPECRSRPRLLAHHVRHLAVACMPTNLSIGIVMSSMSYGSRVAVGERTTSLRVGVHAHDRRARAQLVLRRTGACARTARRCRRSADT